MERFEQSLSVSPSRPLEAPIASVAENVQALGGAASNGTVHLVVWTDARSGAVSIFGTRIAADGTVLDPTGIQISRFPGSAPKVASDGDSFFVVWTDTRNGEQDIFGARVAADGTVLDPDGLPIETAPGAQGNPAVEYTTPVYLVAWEHPSGTDSDIRGRQVTAGGVFFDPFAISTDIGDQVHPAIAALGTFYLVVWEDHRLATTHIFGTRVGSSGVVVSPSGVQLSNGTAQEGVPSVVGGDTEWLVAWEDSRNGGGPDIYGTRVSAAGSPLDNPNLALSVATNFQYFATVAWDGTQYWAAWADQRLGAFQTNILGTRIQTNGTVTDPAGLLIVGTDQDQYAPSLSSRGSSGLHLAWTDKRHSFVQTDVYGGLVSGAGALVVPGGNLLSQSANTQRSAASCFNGTFHWVAWVDGRTASNGGTNETLEVYGHRLGTDGVPLEASSIPIGVGTGWRDSVSIACRGGEALVMWLRAPAIIEGALLGSDGSVGATVTIPSVFGAAPSLASNGTDYLLVWQDNGANVAAVPIAADGTVQLPAIAIASGGGPQLTPKAAWDGTQWRVFWEDQRAGSEIYMARIDSGGTVLDPSGVAIDPGTGGQTGPRVVAHGQTLLVFWTEAPSGTAHLEGAQYGAGDTFARLPGPPTFGTGPRVLRDAIFDGARFWLAWEVSLGTDSNLLAARFEDDGTLVDASPIALTDTSALETDVALSATSPDNLVVSHSVFDTAPDLNAWRIRTTLIQSLPDGAACTADAECANGSCYQGLCGPPPSDCTGPGCAPLDLHVGWSCGASGDAAHGWAPALALVALLVVRRRSRG